MGMAIGSWFFRMAIPAALALSPAVAFAQSCTEKDLVEVLKRGVMPRLTDCTEATAVSALRRTDHPPRVDDGTSNNVQPGTVYKQDPPADATIQSSTPVTIWVSIGPDPETETVDVAVVALTRAEDNSVAGDEVGFQFEIRNVGTGTIGRVMLSVGSSNLADVGVRSNACKDFPCEVRNLAPGASSTVRAAGRVIEAGAYEFHVTSEADGDVDPSNNQMQIVGRAVAPPPPVPPKPTQTPAVAPTPIPAPEPIPPPLPTLPARLEVAIHVLPDHVVRKGGFVRYRIDIRNAGPGDARNVMLDRAILANVSGYTIEAPCKGFPCDLGTLDVNERTSVEGAIGIRFAGKYEAAFPVRWSQGRGGATQQRVLWLRGTTQPVIPWWLWALGAVGLGGGAYFGWQQYDKARVAKWAPRVHVRPLPLPQGDASPIGEIPLAAPPVAITASLKWGDASLVGDLPASRKET